MAITATIPNVFVANTVIKSASMNANFSYLVGILNTNILPAVNVANSIVTTNSSGNFQASSYSSVIGNISPLTTKGDLFGFSSSNARIPVGSDGNVLTADSTQTLGVKWAPRGAPKAPTVQTFLATGSATGYVFTCSSANATVGATYTNNATTFTVLSTISSRTLLFCSSSGAPSSSGTLTKSSGTGDSTITFSAEQALATYTTPSSPSPLYLKVTLIGPGGGGGGSSSGGGSNPGNAGTFASWDTGTVICTAGTGGPAGQNTGTGVGIATGGTSTINSPAITILSQSGQSGGGANEVESGHSFRGGAGGGTIIGGGNMSGNASQSALTPVTNSGGGGGGGPGVSGGAAGGGGGGGGSAIFMITSPSASYVYSLGIVGTGGGGNGVSGSDGALGQMIVEEYYQ